MAANKILCAGLLRGCLCLYQTFISPWWAESLMIFHSHMLCGHLFLTLGLWFGGTHMGFETLRFSEGTFVAEISLRDLSCHLWEQGQPIRNSALPTSLNEASSVNP